MMIVSEDHWTEENHFWGGEGHWKQHYKQSENLRDYLKKNKKNLSAIFVEEKRQADVPWIFIVQRR